MTHPHGFFFNQLKTESIVVLIPVINLEFEIYNRNKKKLFFGSFCEQTEKDP
jgi:hypothetical protein